MVLYKLWLHIERIPARGEPADCAEPVDVGEFNNLKQAEKASVVLQGALESERVRRNNTRIIAKLRKLTDSEIATILHALRIFQDGVFQESAACEHFEDCDMLTDDQIDRLCEQFNFDQVFIDKG